MTDDTFNSRLGNCYELAARYVLANPKWTLVHGAINGARGRLANDPTLNCDNPHAWCYCDDVIWEPITERLLSESRFVNLFGATEFVGYSHHETCKHMLQTGSFGPWDKVSEAKRAVFAEFMKQRSYRSGR